MGKFASENETKAFKKLRDSLDLLINLCERDETEVTEEEFENAIGKFMMAGIGLKVLKQGYKV